MSPGRARAACAAVVLATLAGCTETPLQSEDPDAPGPTAPTLEFSLSAEELPLWRDTTYIGFSIPVDAGFRLLTERPEARSRIVGRFPVPAELVRPPDTLPVVSYDSASVRIGIDTVRSEFVLPTTVRMVALEEAFDAEEATWELAEEGRPWSQPGGALGMSLGQAVLEEVSDSLILEFDVPVDSLLGSWQEEGEPGFALVADTEGTELRVATVVLRFQAEVEGREALLSESRSASPLTFIYDPPQPEPGQELRLGGVPAARFYLTFRPPDTVDGLPIRDAVVNHAEIFFQPLAAPTAPFRLERAVTGRPVQLLADPFELGPRTPIGPVLEIPVLLVPDSLAAGERVGMEVTSRIQAYFEAPPDSAEEIRLGVRLEPDAAAFGFWSFGSEEAAPALQPRLFLVLTPPPGFSLP